MFGNYLRSAIYFGLCGCFLGVISRLTVVDLDLFHEMALIREAFRVGYLPRIDVFSYTPTISPVVHHEWGMGMLIYLITVQLGFGAKGLIVLKYLLTASIAIGSFIFATRRGADPIIFSFLAILAIPLSWDGFSTIRAQLFTLGFLIIFLFLIEADRRGRDWALWAWLPIHLMWLNIHGGFLVGIGLLAVYIGEQFFLNFHEKNIVSYLKVTKRHILFFIATCSLILINPYGIDYVRYIWNAVTLDRTPFILEWRPLWKISWFYLLMWVYSLVIIVYCKPWKSLRQMSGVFIIGATAWASLWHYRHLSLYAIAWMCYTPSFVEKTLLGEVVKRFFKQYSKLMGAIFIIIGISGTLFAVRNQFWHLLIPTRADEGIMGAPVYPAGVVGYLKDNKFSGNLFVPFTIGAYISWNLYPNVKVSLDSRFEVAYPVETVAENIVFYAAQEGWQEALAKYQTDAILIPRWSKVEQKMDENNRDRYNETFATWTRVYIDDGYSLYMKSDLAKGFPPTDRQGEPITACFP